MNVMIPLNENHEYILIRNVFGISICRGEAGWGQGRAMASLPKVSKISFLIGI